MVMLLVSAVTVLPMQERAEELLMDEAYWDRVSRYSLVWMDYSTSDRLANCEVSSAVSMGSVGSWFSSSASRSEMKSVVVVEVVEVVVDESVAIPRSDELMAVVVIILSPSLVVVHT